MDAKRPESRTDGRHMHPVVRRLATVLVALVLTALPTRAEEQLSSRVAVLAAGEAGELCTEDQMAAAWLARRLEERGFSLEGRTTVNEVDRWGQPDVSLVGWSRSAERLRSYGRDEDVDFVLEHVDDLDVVCSYAHGELRAALGPAPRRRVVGEADGAVPEVVS